MATFKALRDNDEMRPRAWWDFIWKHIGNILRWKAILELLGWWKPAIALAVALLVVTRSTYEGQPWSVRIVLTLLAFLVSLTALILVKIGIDYYRGAGLGKARRTEESETQADAPPPLLMLPIGIPKVILASSGRGVDLKVEALGEEVVNVRLVQAESTNYSLRSEVVRYFRVGGPETLVLRCQPRQKMGSPVLQAFSAPLLFFDDLYPTYPGPDVRGALEHELTLVNERQLVVNLELAYSNFSGSAHYRGAFRVRWDRLSQSIVDVEPAGIRLDTDPPSTAPPRVIREECHLQFQEWHGGSSGSLPTKPNGFPTWISIRNSTVRGPSVTARKVNARLEFINSSKTSVHTVPEVEWYVKKQLGNGIEGSGWRGSVDLEGNEEQSFVFFVMDQQNKAWVYKNDTPVAILDYDHWDVYLVVSSENLEGFEGKIGFTLGPNKLEQDKPAFTKLRSVSPRLQLN